MEHKFYVYEWYNKKTQEVFYVGKGCGKRYKETSRRNSLFLEYIKNNEVDIRIVKDNLEEAEAFKLEEKITEDYKKIGQCKCNLAKGGTGGTSSVWTSEFKEYWSENNPMKREEQRQRMRENNPMKNKEIAKKMGETQKRPVFINGIFYTGVKDAANAIGVRDVTITAWCQKGYNPKGEPCRYADEEQKDFVIPPKGRAVIIDGTDYYETITEAAHALGAKSASGLCDALKAKRKYKGHTCEYVNQQPTQ